MAVETACDPPSAVEIKSNRIWPASDGQCNVGTQAGAQFDVSMKRANCGQIRVPSLFGAEPFKVLTEFAGVSAWTFGELIPSVDDNLLFCREHRGVSSGKDLDDPTEVRLKVESDQWELREA